MSIDEIKNLNIKERLILINTIFGSAKIYKKSFCSEKNAKYCNFF